MSTRRRGNAGIGTEVTLPITPMLDMSFQLLFFFITTFKLPTGMEGSMDLTLPSEATAAAAKQENVDTHAPSDITPVDLQAEVTINVTTQAQGTDADGISAITIEETSGKTDIPTPYGKHLEELTSKLLDIVQKKGDKTTVKIQGDSTLHWRGVVKVMDACRNAGLTAISFAQPPDYASYGHN